MDKITTEFRWANIVELHRGPGILWEIVATLTTAMQRRRASSAHLSVQNVDHQIGRIPSKMYRVSTSSCPPVKVLVWGSVVWLAPGSSHVETLLSTYDRSQTCVYGPPPNAQWYMQFTRISCSRLHCFRAPDFRIALRHIHTYGTLGCQDVTG